jgi:hypothetical protein
MEEHPDQDSVSLSRGTSGKKQVATVPNRRTDGQHFHVSQTDFLQTVILTKLVVVVHLPKLIHSNFGYPVCFYYLCISKHFEDNGFI